MTETPKQQSTSLIRLKTVVRRLPSHLPETVFWQSVQPWVSEETSSWKVFYQGKVRKRLNKENIPSRAYILFKNEGYLAVFSREYDGHVFRDKQGNESQAVVEFAPNQKVPPEKKKTDSRHATIQQDEDFLSFIASLENPPTKPIEVDIEALLASTQPPEEPKTTPLLAALREQKLSAQEKKLAVSEAAKTHSRKGGATSKLEAVEATLPPGKKSKKAKGAQPPPGPTATTAVIPIPTKSTSRSVRSNTGRAPGASTSPIPTLSVTGSAGKETTTSAESDLSQKRNRPILGLHSRHLKAALSGAGVHMAPLSPSSSSTVPAALPVTSPSTATEVPPSGPSVVHRSPRGRGGGEKRALEQTKDGAAKGPGGGRGTGKEKARSRHATSGQGTPAASGRPVDITPRILSRQDPPSALNSVGAPPGDRIATGGPQDTGVGRGRGGRRGRGQP